MFVLFLLAGSYSGGDSSGMYPSRFGGGGAEYMSRVRDDVCSSFLFFHEWFLVLLFFMVS